MYLEIRFINHKNYWTKYIYVNVAHTEVRLSAKTIRHFIIYFLNDWFSEFGN